jgi:hypothetical protein
MSVDLNLVPVPATVKQGETNVYHGSKVVNSPLDATLKLSNKLCKIKILVEIDARNTTAPSLAMDSSTKSLYVQYDYSDEIPTKVTQWKLTASDCTGFILGETINVYLQNLDPETSLPFKGTVQPAGGEE